MKLHKTTKNDFQFKNWICKGCGRHINGKPKYKTKWTTPLYFVEAFVCIQCANKEPTNDQ